MTLFEKSVEVLEATITANRDESADWLARRCLDELRKVRIVPHRLRASEEFFTRFHAHARYLGGVAGPSYEYWYNKAIQYAMKVQNWPMKIVPTQVKLDSGEVITVDVPVPDSSTKATNANLMEAYRVIEDEAKIRGIDLPGDSHEQVRT